MIYETQSATLTTLEKVAAAAAHGSMLLGVPIVLPICTLLLAMFVQPSPYVKNQSLQALVFHFVVSFIFGALMLAAAAMGLFGLVAGALAADQAGGEMVLPVNWGLALALALVAMLFLAGASLLSLIATIKALQGKPYSYPLIGGLFK